MNDNSYDINNTRNISTVIKQGKVYSRADLDKMLERLRSN